MKNIVRRTAQMLLVGFGYMSPPALAATTLQCVPYARAVSGVAIYGDALTWWEQAQNRYKRGHTPRKGAVLAFRPYGPMTLGHVAVVSKIVDDRQVLVRHANWSAPGAIEEDVLAMDVSEDGDWSEVRVWHSPTGQMGARVNPTFGFIYADTPNLNPFTPNDSLGRSIRMASAPAAGQARNSVAMRVGQSPQMPGRKMQNAVATRQIAPAKTVRIDYDLTIVSYADARPADRNLDDIIKDVKRTLNPG